MCNLGSGKSPEHKTILKNLPSICEILNDNPSTITPFADSLKTAGIITGPVCGKVKHAKGLGPYDQASELLTAASTNFRYSPRKFYEFLEILRKQGHRNLAQDLYQKCSKCINANACHYYMCMQYQRKVCS